MRPACGKHPQQVGSQRIVAMRPACGKHPQPVREHARALTHHDKRPCISSSVLFMEAAGAFAPRRQRPAAELGGSARLGIMRPGVQVCSSPSMPRERVKLIANSGSKWPFNYAENYQHVEGDKSQVSKATGFSGALITQHVEIERPQITKATGFSGPLITQHVMETDHSLQKQMAFSTTNKLKCAPPCLCGQPILPQCLAVFAPRLSKYVPPGGHWDVGSLCILPYLCGKVDIEMSAAFVYFLISVVRGQAGMLACKCSELCSAKVCAGPGSCVGQLRGKLRAT
eukprot:1161060-Pelagomonas_calceolata.AAC.10